MYHPKQGPQHPDLVPGNAASGVPSFTPEQLEAAGRDESLTGMTGTTSGLQERFAIDPADADPAMQKGRGILTQENQFHGPPAERAGEPDKRLTGLLGQLAAAESDLGLPPETHYQPPSRHPRR
jgi:hypothetical protein